jgi:hypothetical protein
MFFIFNIKSISQAGRRRFEPGLPLQTIKIKLEKRSKEEFERVSALLAFGFVLSAEKIEYTNG